jgi:hypothetical protein
MTPTQELISSEIRRNFQEQYAASLKKDSVENLQMALDIFERYARNEKLTDTERQIVAQVQIMSSVSAVRKIIAEEIQARKPANRQIKRVVTSKRQRLTTLAEREERRQLYAQAVREGKTVADVISERAKKTMEQSETEAT